MTDVQCSAGGAEWGSGVHVEPSPPSDMWWTCCHVCGAWSRIVWTAGVARYAPHAERVPLAARGPMLPVATMVDLGDVFDYELSRAAGWDSLNHTYYEDAS